MSAAPAGQPPALDAIIDAEDEEEYPDDTDTDSALGDGQSTYTTSLASSVFNYPVEYGRRYHAYQHGRYSRPNDELEMDRLLIIHNMVTLATGALFLAPVDMHAAPQRILDIGTGNGVWAVEIADAYPNAFVLGNDLSANMPNFVPPNVKFEVDDVESEWVYDQPFTFIFSRYMAASILDWPLLVQRTYDNLVPGGWAEFQDFDIHYYSEDGTLKPDDPLAVWIKSMGDAAAAIGRDPQPGYKLKGWFEKQGFTNIFHQKYKLPIGTWPRDPKLKQTGLHNFMQINQGLEGLSMRLYTNVMKWTHEQATVMLTEVRRRLHNPNIHAMMDYHVVYGQKPLK